MMAEGVWFLLALAVAGLAAFWSQRRGAPAFGAFAALLIIGGAAQLALTQPLWFPALRLHPNGLPDLAMWAILAVQALAVLGWFWHRGFRHGLCPLARRYGTGRILLLLLLSSGFCVSVMGYFSPDATALRLSPWLAHVAVGGGLIALHLATVTVLLSVAPPVRGTHALSPLAPAFVTVVAGLALSCLAFEGQPHVEDEVAYVFQARTFAAGALTAPLPPAAAMPGLEYYLFDSDGGRWFATTPPGWPAVLALGEAIGAPWIINPALAGLSVLLAHAIVRRRAGRDAADWVAIVMGSSPWLISAAATLMTHTLTLALVLAAWVWVLRAGDRGRSPWAPLFLAGLALGWVFTTRILDGLIVGTLTGMWVLLEGRTGAARAALRAAVYGLGCLATGSLALIYNRLFTGRPLQSPLDRYLAREWGTEGNAYGFGDNIGPPGGWGALDLWRGHSPLEAVINTTSNIVSLQIEFLGWPTGSLVLVFALLIWGFRRPANSRSIRPGDDRPLCFGHAGDVLLLVWRYLPYRAALLVHHGLPACLPVLAWLPRDRRARRRHARGRTAWHVGRADPVPVRRCGVPALARGDEVPWLQRLYVLGAADGRYRGFWRRGGAGKDANERRLGARAERPVAAARPADLPARHRNA